MKILVIHATAGAGHQKAAEAIYYGLKKYTSHEVIIVDALDYSSPLFKKLYRSSYFFLISKVPWFWAFSFGMIDIPILLPLVRLIRRIYNLINVQSLHKFLKEQNFDYIFSTHFMPNEISSALKKKGLITSKVITAVTDYDVHSIWLAKNVDKFAVATDWTKEKLKKMGVPQEKIFVTGIPTIEKFSEKYNKEELRKKLGVKDNIFTVLIATGSFGIGPIEEIIGKIRNCQVIVVCGHNKTLFNSLNAKPNEMVKVFGLVNNMDEIMNVSHAMITKPGGLSISEALVTNLPMIFFNPIPGQETNNIMVLGQYGIGVKGQSIEHIVAELNKLKDSQEFYSTSLKNIQRIARPSAVKDIVALMS
jgi:processive 1,2-diacylglycerol beta-glucosyltransferase